MFTYDLEDNLVGLAIQKLKKEEKESKNQQLTPEEIAKKQAEESGKRHKSFGGCSI